MTLPVDLIEALRSAGSIAVLTGAGISAESGVPTFRDAQTGMWAKYDPSELATPHAFARNPELVTRWYDHRRCDVAKCVPNAGHLALAELQRWVVANGRRFTLITQNVDRLHQLAGSTEVIELHGTLWVWRCTKCGAEAEERGPAFDAHPPRCSCGRYRGYKRPGVVWFGEALPHGTLAEAEEAAENCNVFMSLGTSSVVYPAAGLIDRALARGAHVLEVNPQATPYSDRVHWSLRAKCGEILPRIAAGVSGSANR